MRIGVDIGGTFTDVVLVDQRTGEIKTQKTLTTPLQLERGVLDAVKMTGVNLGEVEYITHGSTIVINALLERDGAKTALITTKGFRDVYEIGRINRPDAFNPAFKKHRPLIPRHMIFEVPERVLANGTIREPLDEEVARAIADVLKAEAVEAVAVLFLHSYRYPEHEIRMAEILREAIPDIFVTASHEIMREYREYERTSTAVANAFVGPKVDDYIGKLESTLRADNFRGSLLIMQSNGGVTDTARARRQCIQMMESGPAGGVVGASALADLFDLESIITLDVGGTTAKAAAIRRGQPAFAPAYYVGGYESGLVIRVPTYDIVEVGTGGGSLAWLDEVGALHVGPASAGAEPGPACYGRGGILPTITDACVVLGRLAPESFLGGVMRLNWRAAYEALKTKLADPMGMEDVERVADGVLTVATAAMSSAVRQVTVRRGLDPREFTLIAYGGNGPMEAVAIADELGITRVVIPPAPGVFSALGMLVADLRADYVKTIFLTLDEATAGQLESELQALQQEALADFKRSGLKARALTFERVADMRYIGQEHTVPVVLPSVLSDTSASSTVKAHFDEAHAQLYSHSAPDEGAEIVSVRVSLVGSMTKPEYQVLPHGASEPDEASMKGYRRVSFTGVGFVNARVYDRGRLLCGNELFGPAVIEEPQSTTLLPPLHNMVVGEFGQLVLTS